jgi:signal transduction histidine kinase
MMESLTREKGIALELKCGSPVSIASDKLRLRQIMINLIGNAVKFTNQGAVTLEITSGQGQPPAPCPQDFLEKARNGRWVQVAVRDTGIGIKPEHRKTLFEEFRQGDASTTHEYGGTGLGLALVKKLSELLGGGVALESEMGTGSVFAVMLPCRSGVRESNGDSDASVIAIPVKKKQEKD